MAKPDLEKTLIDLIKWHESGVAECQMIIDEDDCDLVLNTGDGGRFVIKAGSKDKRLIQLGVMLVLERLTPLPVSIISLRIGQ